MMDGCQSLTLVIDQCVSKRIVTGLSDRPSDLVSAVRAGKYVRQLFLFRIEGHFYTHNGLGIITPYRKTGFSVA
jgi:hypothetical protein